MIEVAVFQQTVVTTNGRTRVREIQYFGQLDGMGIFHPVRCVGKIFSLQRPQAVVLGRRKAA